jgi:hypothetical protein
MDWQRRTWVIPAASLLPLAAIVYAFSLGPSPEKLAQTRRDTGTAQVDTGSTQPVLPAVGVHAVSVSR